jgi:hypothetical protein
LVSRRVEKEGESMTKRELLKLLKDVPMDAVIGFRANDLGEDCPGEHFRTGFELEPDDFAKKEGFDFLFI